MQIVGFCKPMSPLFRTCIMVYNAPNFVLCSRTNYETADRYPAGSGHQTGLPEPNRHHQIAKHLGNRLRLLCTSNLAFLGSELMRRRRHQYHQLQRLAKADVPATFCAWEHGGAATTRDLHRLWYNFYALACRHANSSWSK